MPQPDYRIHEMNKRLQQRTDDSDNLWWDAFATEFFEDDANLTLTFCLEDGPKRYSNIRFSQIYYFENKNKNFVNRFQKNDSTTCSMQQTEDTYFLWYRIDVAKKLVTE